jgi:hypothetical protein
MGTGLFPHSTAQGIGARAHQRKLRPRRGPPPNRATLDAFAEALAEAGTIAAASKAVGLCHQRGSQLLRRIRDELGWQAQ